MSPKIEPKKTYGNFKNPIGLIFRMLRSGKRPAYSALYRAGLKIIATPLDLVLAPYEKRQLTKGQSKRNYPLILIVGPPRGGTTLIYQVLSKKLDVTFPNNLCSLFPRSTTIANTWISKYSSSYSSYYGQTARMSGVNDGFHIWNRWLGEDRYSATADLDTEAAAEMREFFDSWTAIHQKPFLNKNNRNTDDVSLLAQHLPNAYFVFVSRDPTAIARSLIRARQTVQGDKKIGWGLQSQEVHANDGPFGYVRDVCEQVKCIQQKMNDEVAKIDPNRLIETSYEEFCQSPQRCLNQLIERIPGLKMRPDETQPVFLKESIQHQLSEAEEQIMSDLLATQHRMVLNSCPSK